MIKFLTSSKFILAFESAEGYYFLHSVSTVFSNYFDPVLLDIYPDLPQNISVYKYVHNVDSAGELHGACNGGSMILTWRNENGVIHHDTHPALFKIINYKYVFDHGKFVSFMAESIHAAWFIDGKRKRISGPKSVVISRPRFTAGGEPHGAVTKVDWVHPNNKSKITIPIIAEKIKSTGVKPNLTALGDSVFKDDMENMFFYSN